MLVQGCFYIFSWGMFAIIVICKGVRPLYMYILSQYTLSLIGALSLILCTLLGCAMLGSVLSWARTALATSIMKTTSIFSVSVTRWKAANALLSRCGVLRVDVMVC